MVLFLKIIFRPKHEVFLAKIQKTSKAGKIRNYEEDRVFFREKKRVHVFKGLEQKREGAKYAGCSRPSRFKSTHRRT